MRASDLRISAATVSVPGPHGRDAALVDGRLFAVASGRSRDGVAGQVLQEVALALGPQPSTRELRRTFEHVIGALPPNGKPGRADLTGVVIAIAAAARLTVGQAGSALAYLISDGLSSLLTDGRRPGFDVLDLFLEPGDRLLLCTDGYWPLLDGELLATVALQPPQEAVARLQELAGLHAVDHGAAIMLAVRAADRQADDATAEP
jgi:serine/threonine protein phosphatase PrpC